MSTGRAAVAELVGSFALMFAGGCAIIAGGDLVTVALAHGLILSVMVSATMHISGAQFNPAVSIALVTIGKQSWKRAAVFIAAQVEGMILAAYLLKVCVAPAFPPEQAGMLGATLGTFTGAGDATMVNIGAAVALEAIAAFFLMFVIMGTAADPRGVGGNRAVGGFGIGLTVAACILAIGPLTGASMNPARSFAPALIAGAWDHHWLYWLAPIAGAILAAHTYHRVFTPAPAGSQK